VLSSLPLLLARDPGSARRPSSSPGMPIQSATRTALTSRSRPKLAASGPGSSRAHSYRFSVVYESTLTIVEPISLLPSL
jgi:hypothetical protein